MRMERRRGQESRHWQMLEARPWQPLRSRSLCLSSWLRFNREIGGRHRDDVVIRCSRVARGISQIFAIRPNADNSASIANGNTDWIRIGSAGNLAIKDELRGSR